MHRLDTAEFPSLSEMEPSFRSLYLLRISSGLKVIKLVVSQMTVT